MKKRDHLRAIVARGYCHPLNSGKALDSALLEAIVDELLKDAQDALQLISAERERQVEPECKRCHQTMLIRDGEEPTEVCDHCAHEMLSAISDVVLHNRVDSWASQLLAAPQSSVPTGRHDGSGDPDTSNAKLWVPAAPQSTPAPAKFFLICPVCGKEAEPGEYVGIAGCSSCNPVKFYTSDSGKPSTPAVADAPDMRKLKKRAEKWLHAHSFTNYWSMELAEEFVAVAKSLAAASTPPAVADAHNWTAKEREAIADLMARQDLSEHAVLRQGLRMYQLVVLGSHKLVEINPTNELAAASTPARGESERREREKWFADLHESLRRLIVSTELTDEEGEVLLTEVRARIRRKPAQGEK